MKPQVLRLTDPPAHSSRRSPSRRCAARRLFGKLAHLRWRNRAGYRPSFGEGDRLTVMCDPERFSLAQRIASLFLVDLDLQPPPAETEAEGQATEPLGQPVARR
jgi:hypothetical protein